MIGKIESSTRNAMRWLSTLILLVGVVTAAQSMPSVNGCQKYCNNNGKCVRECEAAIQKDRTEEYKKFTVGTRFVGLVDTDTEITGSDSVGKRGSRISCFVTREGKIFFLSPGPVNEDVPEVISPEIKLLWTLPDYLNLDTRNNKGLYSIAFSREKAPIISMYILYAAKPENARLYDHNLCVAQLSYNIVAQLVDFVEVIYRLPQNSNTRSGGFMVMGLANYEVEKIPLWISSGGNEYNDFELMKTEPRYSAISAVWSKERVAYPGLALDYVQETVMPILWANAIHNPLQCDYSPILNSRVMPCLAEVKGIDGEVESVLVAAYEKGHTFDNHTAEIFQAWGSTSLLKMHAEQYIYYVTSDCLPESIYYNTAMAIGTRYMNKVLIAQPTCRAERFAPARVSFLHRNYLTMDKEFRAIDVALIQPYLHNVELIGSEMNRGLFLAGRSLVTGNYEIYMLYDRTEELARMEKAERAAKRKKKK